MTSASPIPNQSPIPHHWAVPQEFRERMGTQAGRQRCMAVDGHVLVVLHDIPDPERPEHREAKLFWRAPDGKWNASSGGPPNISSLRAHVEGFVDAASRLETLGDEADSADDWFALVYAASPMLRSARNMHRALQEARDAAKLDRALIAVRDLAGDAERAFELVHDHAKEGLEYTIAKQAEQQARDGRHMLEAAHRLNMIAAVFLPVTAVATLLGMNLRHGLEDFPAPWTFWITLALTFVLGLWIKASMPRPTTGADDQAPGPRRLAKRASAAKTR
jgi:Mg2+ and Co2+ transporter CorA